MNKYSLSKSFQNLFVVLFIGLSLQSNPYYAQNGNVGFTYTINKADTPAVKNTTMNLSEQTLLSLPGKSIHDNDVKSIINHNAFYWDVTKDTIPDGKGNDGKHYYIQKTYFNYKLGFEMIFNSDTVFRVVLYNNYEERPYRIWKKYDGILPYKLDFDLRRVFVERLLGKPDFVGSKSLTVGYLDRHLIITYNDADPESGIINSITIERK